MKIKRTVILSLIALLAFSVSRAQDRKALTVTDIMKFRRLESPQISNDGKWVVLTSRPDRGDPEVQVHSTDGKKEFIIPLGEKPVFSNDGKWVAAVQAVPAEIILNRKPGKGDDHKAGLVLLNTSTGEQTLYENVQSFRFSNDSKWLLYQDVKGNGEEKEGNSEDFDGPGSGYSKLDLVGDRFADGEGIFPGEFTPGNPIPHGEIFDGFATYGDSIKPGEAGAGREEAGKEETGKEEAGREGAGKKSPRKSSGSTLHLVSLDDTTRISYPYVKAFEVDSLSHYLAFAVSDSNGNGNGVFITDLKSPAEDPTGVYQDSCAWADCFCWNNRGGQLAFLAGITDKSENPREALLYLWTPGTEEADLVLADGDLSGDWRIYHKNKLEWTLDGKRLFLGTKPASEIVPPNDVKEDSVSKVFNVDAILGDRGVDVWHWNDPYINPNQKRMWNREKDRTYTGSYNLETGQFVQMADPDMPELRRSDKARTLLGYSNVPYAKRVTWEGRFLDVYLVDLETGVRNLVIREQQHSVSISPDGRFLVYFRKGDWHLIETSSGSTRNLTHGLGVPFADEDWDYPGDVPGYGVGGWIADPVEENAGGRSRSGSSTASVLIYDKFDIWMFPSKGGRAVCLTEGKGRKEDYQFRLARLDRDREYLESGEKVLLTAYHGLRKFTAVYTMKTGAPGVNRMVEEPVKFSLLAKAKDADRILYTRETYTEFPDLRVTDMNFKKPRRLTDLNPQISEFAWGQAELVDWTTAEGIPLQGVLIKPGNYKPGQKYPVLVYYYRFFSNRLYEFNQVVINHRPCFPFYASNGYAIFLPDIRFKVGEPGPSATSCLVSGVQKIIDMGIADPHAICLHGHSWSGYQTAFVITRTDMFACAIAGAPVSNMTSAYDGIRWGTGLARQFQYEESQSRIGGSLWEARDKYIENSPVFFADHINTPLLIEFGDEDDAVPWYQGIELYLAMRRLGKDCVFLEYRGEPHHLRQYANKLDYTLKFKQYLDHYLKGEPAPDWISKGVPYRGE